ncbi:hypothetical protein [Ferrovum sp. PN-J185]|nr:hypothetical protein [Ferrovum sp. PN-J185]
MATSVSGILGASKLSIDVLAPIFAPKFLGCHRTKLDFVGKNSL